MTKELKLDPTTVKLKDWLSEQLKKDDQPIVQLLSVEFPIEKINHQQQIQEQDFPKAAQALGLNGYVKDHHGIVFKEPLTKKLRETIVDQLNCKSVTNPRNAILWLLLSTILLVISFLGLCDVIFNFSVLISIGVIALACLGLACAFRSDTLFDKLHNPVKRNEALIDKLNQYYCDVIKLRQNMIPNLPTVNLSFKERKAERKSKTTTSSDVTPTWTASTSSHGSSSSVPDTNDDHFWRDMFFMDQISDALDDHDNYNDSNDYDDSSDSDWGNDDSSDFDSGSDWGSDDFGGSDWGGGDDFGGSDW